MSRCKQSGCLKVIVERSPARRGRPRVYCPEHQDRSARGYWSSRKRSYERCSQCQKVNELRWGDKQYCSAYCYGVGIQIAQGIPLEEAESAVAAAIAADPSLVSRKPPKGPQRASWCPKCGGEKGCFYWCKGVAARATESGIIGNLLYDLPAVSVAERFTSLGGHLGPQSATDPIVSADHPWFQANPEWWNRPSRVTLYGMTLPVKVVTFLNVAHMVSEALQESQALAA